MPPSATNPRFDINAVVGQRTLSLGSRHEDLSGRSVAPQGPGRHLNDSAAIPLAEDASAERPTEDLEALHQAPSAPAYSAFSHGQKRFIIFMVACAGFFSPLSANIYFPALNALSRDLRVSNGLINLTLTSYMIFQGLAPTIFGDLGDMTGRRPAYILGFIIYIGRMLHYPTPWILADTPARRKHWACLTKQLHRFAGLTVLAELW